MNEFDVPLSPEEIFIVLSIQTCIGWITGLLILIVGFVSARSAVARAGYMIGGAGALLLFRFCCAYLPVAAWRAGQGFMGGTVGQISYVMSLLCELLFAGLFLGGVVVLAREATARRAIGGAK